VLVVPVVAFGEWFVEHAQILLASLQSAGNLPDVESKVIVYTDQPEAFPGYEVVHLTQKIITRRMGERGSKHLVTTNCYAEAMRLGHPIVPASADMICPTGMLAALERLARNYRVVLVPVLRTNSHRMRKALGPVNGPISLSPRELCRKGFANLHELQEHMYWDNLPSDVAPTTIFRRLGDTIVARCFHMHPIMLRLPPDTALSPSIDGELMARMPLQDCYVVQDSDETVVFDLTATDYNWSAGYLDRFGPKMSIKHWANSKANKTHRWFFAHECTIHAGEIERLPPEPGLDALCAQINAMP